MKLVASFSTISAGHRRRPSRSRMAPWTLLVAVVATLIVVSLSSIIDPNNPSTVQVISAFTIPSIPTTKKSSISPNPGNFPRQIHVVERDSMDLEQRQYGFSRTTTTTTSLHVQSRRQRTTTDTPSDDVSGTLRSTISFDGLYGVLWIGFLVYGIFFSPGEVGNPSDNALIMELIQDPTNQLHSVNPLFFAIFNGLGIVPLVMSQLIVPTLRLSSSSSDDDNDDNSNSSIGFASPVPFLLGSFAAGYGSLGLYLTFRKQQQSNTTTNGSINQLSWFTKNVLESKLFAGGVALVCSSLFVTSGLLSSIFIDHNFNSILVEYQQLASTSKLVTVSTVDLSILTIVAATLIPNDYKFRIQQQQKRQLSNDDGNNTLPIQVLAASTVLLPLVGAAIYCALRPPLGGEESLE